MTYLSVRTGMYACTVEPPSLWRCHRGEGATECGRLWCLAATPLQSESESSTVANECRDTNLNGLPISYNHHPLGLGGRDYDKCDYGSQGGTRRSLLCWSSEARVRCRRWPAVGSQFGPIRRSLRRRRSGRWGENGLRERKQITESKKTGTTTAPCLANIRISLFYNLGEKGRK